MDCTYTDVPYADTGYFSSFVNAYIAGDPRLAPFYQFPVSREGLASAISARAKFPVDRKLLADTLRIQYESLPKNGTVDDNVELLLHENTFTVCTAHQPAIFTGNLFFIYKILHAIRLASWLKEQHPSANFVPVFYMGSEDADLDELGNIFLNGEKLVWDTKQTGAIGRMNTKGLEKILARAEGELAVFPFGKELISLLKKCYLESADIQTATLKLVHHLFSRYGLIVLIADNPLLKKTVAHIFADELLHQRSGKIVNETIKPLEKNFRVQAYPRDINLFYLINDIRARIEVQSDRWRVVDTNLSFSKEEILRELNEHPERFSPNVILRGILQESLLPSVAFIGGGGELAYWLELKDLFAHYQVFFPMLIVRNSFLVIDNRSAERIRKLRLPITDIFRSEDELLRMIVHRDSPRQLRLEKETGEMTSVYEQLQRIAASVDPTLSKHVGALASRAMKGIQTLEKKMLRAEKRKYSDDASHVRQMRNSLFPNGGLQERVENFMPFYARWGSAFIDMIWENSQTIDQRFRILSTVR